MTNKQKRYLAELVSDYQALAAIGKANEAQKQALKQQIGAFVEPFGAEFAGGEFIVLGPAGERVGAIKQVSNAPRLVRIDSDDELTALETAKLIEKLDPRYLTQKPNVALMRDLSDDKNLAKVLQKLGVEVLQTTRFDVKP